MRQVSYNTDNFLEKNRDFVVAEHQLLLEASSQDFVRTLFPPDPDAGEQVPTPSSNELSNSEPGGHTQCSSTPWCQRAR